jgi:hypothetical protein
MDLMQAVITTKYVVESNSKIVFVYHSKDGWQFFGAEKDITEFDSRVVSLERLLTSNPQIKDILWIDEGMEAWINHNTNVWQIGLSNY